MGGAGGGGSSISMEARRGSIVDRRLEAEVMRFSRSMAKMIFFW